MSNKTPDAINTSAAIPNAEALLETLATNLQERLQQSEISAPYLVGVATGGVWVARRLHKMLALEGDAGIISSNYYRDDFDRNGLHPRLETTQLSDVTDRHVVLVDDVLHTGRTVRATLNELFDFGRPASVMLAVLADRGGRELPVCADVAAWSGELASGQSLRLTGPEPLQLILKNSSEGAK
mgnify:CR=1 FL=1